MKRRGPWKVKQSKTVYKNPWISVREDRVIHPDGSPGIFGVVSIIPGSSTIPMDEKGNVYLIEEYCYGIGRKTIQAVSGGIEKGENKLTAAKRELKEETGFYAKEWTYLGFIDPFTMIIPSANYMYLARGLITGNASPEGSETLKIIKLPFREALQLLEKGKITHGATCVALLKIAMMKIKRK